MLVAPGEVFFEIDAWKVVQSLGWLGDSVKDQWSHVPRLTALQDFFLRCYDGLLFAISAFLIFSEVQWPVCRNVLSRVGTRYEMLLRLFLWCNEVRQLNERLIARQYGLLLLSFRCPVLLNLQVQVHELFDWVTSREQDLWQIALHLLVDFCSDVDSVLVRLAATSNLILLVEVH